MKQRAFTLMELMIVIVIIGILSAVGMVMFGGQSEKAKAAVVQANYKMTVKRVALIIFECNLNGFVMLMSGDYNNTDNTSEFTTNCYGNNKYYFFGSYVKNDFRNREFKNPYADASDHHSSSYGHYHLPCSAADGGATSNIGKIYIEAYEQWDYVTVCTCFKKPCKDSSNRLENKIYLF